jgi:DNA-binding CsgD family transcriptional regulator
LTEREREVLALVSRGRGNQEIAADLVVSEATVKTHMNRLLSKLGASSRAQLVVIAYESGFVRPGSTSGARPRVDDPSSSAKLIGRSAGFPSGHSVRRTE